MKRALLQSAHLLIISNETQNLLFLTNLFRRHGFRNLQTTTDASELTNHVQQKEPDLVFLDLITPSSKGFKALNDLKQLSTSYLPTLILVAQDDKETKQTVLKAGANDTLSHPLDPMDVLKRTTTHLQMRFLHKDNQRKKQEVQTLSKENKLLNSQNERLEYAQLDILSRLARACEYRDDDTGEHTYRVARLSYQTALELGLPEHFATLILRSARLHDIGKLGIPDAILLKPGRLTDEENSLMQAHCIIGAELLAGSDSELLDVARSIALNHHERFDGRGYPNALVAKEIPIEARIVAVVDVYDALTHSRPYKKAWTHEEALHVLRQEKGHSFDPDVVEAFVNVIDPELDISYETKVVSFSQ